MVSTYANESFLKQSQVTRKNYSVEFSDRMGSGVTLDSASAWIIVDSDTTPDFASGTALGTALALSNNDAGVQAIATAVVLASEVTSAATWLLDIRGTLSDSQTPEVRLAIEVLF